jgi:hypothetical protein
MFKISAKNPFSTWKSGWRREKVNKNLNRKNHTLPGAFRYFAANILSRIASFCVTYKTGFRLDDWIYCTLYIHTTRDYMQYSATTIYTHFTVHRYTRARVLSLHQLYPGNGFIKVSLSLQITHEVFFSPPNSFLCHFFSVILDCHLQNSTHFLTTTHSNELFFKTLSTSDNN